jgi:hypothetical protein
MQYLVPGSLPTGMSQACVELTVRNLLVDCSRMKKDQIQKRAFSLVPSQQKIMMRRFQFRGRDSRSLLDTFTFPSKYITFTDQSFMPLIVIETCLSMKQRNPGYAEAFVFREFVEFATKIFFTISKSDSATFHPPHPNEIVRDALCWCLLCRGELRQRQEPSCGHNLVTTL